jgi:hypothetical protein
MTITVITNQTASAPSLTGIAGSLIAVLDFCLVTTLGWTKPYSSTNLAAYKQPAGSNGFYLYVDDTGGQDARFRAYETMSSISSGTGPVPTDVQLSGGLHLYKSSAASSTTRPWYFISDGKMFYLVTSPAGTTPSTWGTANNAYAFGDFKSYKSGDAYNTLVVGDTSASATSSSIQFVNLSSAFNSLSGGSYMMRANTQIGTSTGFARFTDYAGGGGMSNLQGTIPYPSPIDGGINLARLFIGEASAGRRGYMPGAWAWMHAVNQANALDTFSGAGDLAGRTFVYMPLGNSYAFVLETSDTWYS